MGISDYEAQSGWLACVVKPSSSSSSSNMCALGMTLAPVGLAAVRWHPGVVLMVSDV